MSTFDKLNPFQGRPTLLWRQCMCTANILGKELKIIKFSQIILPNPIFLSPFPLAKNSCEQICQYKSLLGAPVHFRFNFSFKISRELDDPFFSDLRSDPDPFVKMDLRSDPILSSPWKKDLQSDTIRSFSILFDPFRSDPYRLCLRQFSPPKMIWISYRSLKFMIL